MVLNAFHGSTGWHKKNGNFRKTWQKLKKSKEKNVLTEIEPTCLLRDSNPNYQCLKITSCRWHPPPRMHSFTATTHFKSFHSFVSPCACCMLCRMRLCCMVQFLSINFFPWISSIFVGFFKSSHFFVSPCTITEPPCPAQWMEFKPPASMKGKIKPHTN